MSNSNHTKPGGPPTQAGSAYRGGSAHLNQAIEERPQLAISSALRIGEADKARGYLVEAETASFGAAHDEERVILDEQIGNDEHELEEARNELGNAKSELSKTPERLPSCHANQGRARQDFVEVPYSEWQSRHKTEAVFLLITLGLASITSLLTAHANLVGSGLQVFLDNGGLLAWSMAALAPLSGFAVKTIYEQLPGFWLRDAFKLALIVAMVISIICWVLIYAETYHGLSPDASLGGLFEEPTLWEQMRDTAFTAISLTTEVLIGAVLALRLTIIAGTYSPDYSHANPDFARLTARVEALQVQVRELATALAEKKGRRAAIESALKLQLVTATLAHEGRRGASETPIL